MRRPADGPRTKGGAPPTVAKDEGCGPARSGERVTVTPVFPRLNYNCNMRAWRPGSSAHVLPASPIGRARGRRIGVLVGILGVAGLAACGSTRPPNGMPGTGGTGGNVSAGTGGAGSTDPTDAADATKDAPDDHVGDAGQPATGGNGGGAAGSGGATTGAGGAAGVAGAAGGAGVSGSGGSSAGGAGLGGAGGEGPLPSPGCALANPTPPETVGDSVHKWDVVLRKFPSAYDGKTPMPLLLALHATGYSAQNMWNDLGRDQPLAAPYIFVGPQESRQSFVSLEDRVPLDLSLLIDGLLRELCIDERRIFGAGNGSGGRFLFRWIAATANPVFNVNPTVPQLRAAAMVGIYITGPRQGPLPTIFIHPLKTSSSTDPDGAMAAQSFATRNACGTSTTPATSGETAGCGLTPGCVDFDSCSAPLRWCQHNGTDHGEDPWPCFASA